MDNNRKKLKKTLIALIATLTIFIAALPFSALADDGNAPASTSVASTSPVESGGSGGLPAGSEEPAAPATSPASDNDSTPEIQEPTSPATPQDTSGSADETTPSTLATVVFFDAAGAELSRIEVEKNTLLPAESIPSTGTDFAGWYEKETAEKIQAAQAAYAEEWQAYLETYLHWDGTGEEPAAPQPVNFDDFGQPADVTAPVSKNWQLQAVTYPAALSPAISTYSLTEFPVASLADLENAVNAINSGQEIVIKLQADFTLDNPLTVKGNFIMVPDGGTTLTQTYLIKEHFIFDSSERDITVDFTGISLVGNNTGGGIEATGGGTVYFTGGSIQHCRKVNGGGVQITGHSTFIMSGGLIDQNKSAHNGSGVYVDNSNFILNGGTISNNIPAPENSGGGVAVVGASATFIMNGGRIEGNHGFTSGGIYAVDSTLILNSGVICDSKDLQFIYDYSNGIYIQTGVLSISGDVSISGNTGYGIYTDNSVVTMSGGTVTDNGIGGMVIQRTQPNDSIIDLNMSGGAVEGNHSTGITFRDATAIISGQAKIDRNDGWAVGLHIVGSKLTLNGGSISGNAIGGLEADLNSSVIMNGGIISGNTGNAYAGGVYITKSTFTMNGGEISGNTADYRGGGLYVAEEGIAEMNGGTIHGNHSAKGGGVFINQGIFTMKGGTISNNDATTSSAQNSGCGGGVYLNAEDTDIATAFILINGSITGNTAEADGGGVFATNFGNPNDITFSMRGGLIANNTADQNGGGVCVNDATFTLSGGTIKDNTADGNGGGIYAGSNIRFEMSDGIIQHNSAENGGGLYLADNQTTASLTKGNLAGNIATYDGGGIFTEDYENLSVGANTVFSSNSAGNGSYILADTDPLMATYTTKILATQFTSSFYRGYNNLDINYTAGAPSATAGYKVQYYQQQLDGSYPNTPTEITNSTGITGTIPALMLKTYPGFTCQTSQTTYECTGKPITFVTQPIVSDGSLIVKVYYSRNTYTIIYKPGSNGDFADNVHTGVMYGAPVPNYTGATDGGNPKGQSGYSFNGWSPAKDAVVTSNHTYTAQWAANNVPPDSSNTSSGSSSSSSSSSRPSSSSSSSSTPASSSSSSRPASSSSVPPASSSGNRENTSTVISYESDVQDALNKQGNQSVVTNILNGNVPLGNMKIVGAWGLLNLLLAILSAAGAIGGILFWLLKKRTFHLYESNGNPIESKIHGLLLVAIRTFAIVCGFLTLILFVILENMSLPMVFVNIHTPVILLFFVLQLLAFIVMLPVKKARDQAEQRVLLQNDKEINDWLNKP